MNEDEDTPSTVRPLLNYPNRPSSAPEDAGSKFVLESKGTWLHAGYHLTAATAGTPLLALPYAVADLGWTFGLIALSAAAIISFYACYVLSLTVDKLETDGKHCPRLWDVAVHTIGPSWAYYVVAPLQYLGCFIVVVALLLLGGKTLEGVFTDGFLNNFLNLYGCIIVVGIFVLGLSQLPSFHSLRHLNLLSLMLCLGFCICSVAGSIVSGVSSEAPVKDYSIQGSSIHIMFGVFNAVSIMMTAYANPIIVEIQATIEPPSTGKILKGLLVCYAVVLSTFFSVSISGYWAFGNSVEGVVFSSMAPYAPTWLTILGNALGCVQTIIAVVVYLQPLFAKYEGLVANANAGQFSLRNMFPRIVGRALLVGITVLLAAMLPFFEDFSALMGALGFIPLCIILPLLFYTLVFNEKKTVGKRLLHTLNAVIICISVVVTLLGTIAAVRKIVLDVDTYSLFPAS